ncbi:MAG: GLUG motif-containing protein, partial [Rhizomicrobium sp.]
NDSSAGGLVGAAGSSVIDGCYATGSVKVGAGSRHGGATAGGLIGTSTAVVTNSYATGSVSGGQLAYVGGFVGWNDISSIMASYSTGAVSAGGDAKVGGFIGANFASRGTVDKTYWNVDTSGTSVAVGKGGDHGIKGLTTEQLRSALPDGFDPGVWAQDPNIKKGYPYLRANPPR